MITPTILSIYHFHLRIASDSGFLGRIGEVRPQSGTQERRITNLVNVGVFEQPLLYSSGRVTGAFAYTGHRRDCVDTDALRAARSRERTKVKEVEANRKGSHAPK